jgi:hypothetical protein
MDALSLCLRSAHVKASVGSHKVMRFCSNSAPCLDKCPNLDQIRHIKPFAEPAVDPDQQAASLGVAYITDEYIKLCRKMGWTPMFTVNLGTGTPEEARNWVEYCNCPPGRITRTCTSPTAAMSRTPSSSAVWAMKWTAPGNWDMSLPINTPSARNKPPR